MAAQGCRKIGFMNHPAILFLLERDPYLFYRQEEGVLPPVLLEPESAVLPPSETQVQIQQRLLKV